MPQNSDEPPARVFATAVFFGLVGGALHLWVNPVQVSIGLLFVMAFAISLAHPQGAWRWALLMALAVTAIHSLWNMLVLELPFEPERIYPTLLTMIPTFSGAYTGVFLRWRADKLKYESRDRSE